MSKNKSTPGIAFGIPEEKIRECAVAALDALIGALRTPRPPAVQPPTSTPNTSPFPGVLLSGGPTMRPEISEAISVLSTLQQYAPRGIESVLGPGGGDLVQEVLKNLRRQGEGDDWRGDDDAE